MFIDPKKLSADADFRNRLSKLIDTPLLDRAADPLIWECDGKAVGFTNLNNIQRGFEADIHLHLFEGSVRAKGLGRRLFAKSVQKYFERHDLKRIVCQPASTNSAPNGLMKALGVPVARTHQTIPSAICFEHEVNRYEITKTWVTEICRLHELPMTQQKSI